METEALNLRNKIKFQSHFVALSKEQLSDQGFSETRTKCALLIQSMEFGVVATLISILYSLYILSILASEEYIYDKWQAAIAVESVELLFMALFSFEIVVYLTIFGPKLYFRDLANFWDVVLILLTIIWYILDLANSDRFREKAAFRVIRVVLMLWRLRFSYFSFVARIKNDKSTYNAEVPFDQVCRILSNLRDRITDSKLASDLNYWLDIIITGSIYSNKSKIKSQNKEIKTRNDKDNNLKPKLEVVKKNIQKNIDKIDLK